MKANIASLIIIYITTSLFFLTGCATLRQKNPAKVLPASQWIGMLPPESYIIVKVDMQSNRKTLEKLFISLDNEKEEKILRRIVEKTDFIYASLSSPENKISGEERPELSLVAIGSYPKAAINCNLSGDKEWGKGEKGEIWWQHKTTGFQVAVPQKHLLLLSTGKVEGMLARTGGERNYNIPEEVEKELEVSDIVLYMPEPGGVKMSGVSADIGNLPIKDFWITLLLVNEEYIGSGVFRLRDEKDARAVSLLSRLLLIAWMRKEGVGDISDLIEKVEVKTEGNYVRIKGLSFSSDVLAHLLLSKIETELGTMVQ